jgi:hypothetical protein
VLRQIDHIVPSQRPFRITADGAGRTVVTCSDEGQCNVLSVNSDGLSLAGAFDLGRGVTWVALDPRAERLAVGFATHIELYEFPTFRPVARLDVVRASNCIFLDHGRSLCTAGEGRGPSGIGMQLELWDRATPRAVAWEPLPRRGYDYMLFPHPEGEVVAAVAFSGQHEEWMFWAHCGDGRVRVFEQAKIQDVPLPCFHPAGDEFLAVHEQLGLCRMRFPCGDVIDSLLPENAFPDEDGIDPEDRHFGYDMCYVSDDSALIHDTDRGLYRLELDPLNVADPVLTHIDGAAVGLDGFFLSGFQCLSGKLLLTTELHVGTRFSGLTWGLRLWDASSLFGPLTGPDRRHPNTAALIGGNR